MIRGEFCAALMKRHALTDKKEILHQKRYREK